MGYKVCMWHPTCLVFLQAVTHGAISCFSSPKDLFSIFFCSFTIQTSVILPPLACWIAAFHPYPVYSPTDSTSIKLHSSQLCPAQQKSGTMSQLRNKSAPGTGEQLKGCSTTIPFLVRSQILELLP